jgi:hypothetical protein
VIRPGGGVTLLFNSRLHGCQTGICQAILKTASGSPLFNPTVCNELRDHGWAIVQIYSLHPRERSERLHKLALAGVDGHFPIRCLIPIDQGNEARPSQPVKLCKPSGPGLSRKGPVASSRKAALGLRL